MMAGKDLIGTIYMSYSITITVYSIYLYMRYGIEKVENLTKAVCVVTAISFFFMGIFYKDENGERVPFWMTTIYVVMFSLGSIAFNRKYLKLEHNEVPIKYFLLHLLMIVLVGLCSSFAILAIISYILTGDVDTLIRGR